MVLTSASGSTKREQKHFGHWMELQQARMRRDEHSEWHAHPLVAVPIARDSNGGVTHSLLGRVRTIPVMHWWHTRSLHGSTRIMSCDAMRSNASQHTGHVISDGRRRFVGVSASVSAPVDAAARFLGVMRALEEEEDEEVVPVRRRGDAFDMAGCVGVVGRALGRLSRSPFALQGRRRWLHED